MFSDFWSDSGGTSSCAECGRVLQSTVGWTDSVETGHKEQERKMFDNVRDICRRRCSEEAHLPLRCSIRKALLP
jgi:hypothetical protein